MSEIATYYLEMKAPQMLNEKPKPDGFDVLEAEIRQYELNRFLYQFVGDGWNWNDKDSFSDEKWREYSESENLRTWVAYFRGSISGYFELERQPNSNVEITYFGLGRHRTCLVTHMFARSRECIN